MSHPTSLRHTAGHLASPAGWPAVIAATHVERLRALPRRHDVQPVLLAVQGPGGYGKTALLAALSAHFTDAGNAVHAGIPDDEPTDATVLLVDDAHALDAQSLDRLCRLAREGRVGLIVAYRPSPRPELLRVLIELLSRDGPPLSLRPLEVEDLPEALEQHGPERLERLISDTGGVPRLLSRALSALPRHDRDAPPALLESFRHDLDRLDESARHCLLALAQGGAAHPDALARLLDLDPQVVTNALADVRASGLVDVEDVPLPLPRRAVLGLTPWDRRLAVLRRLVDSRLARGASVLELVRPLLGSSAALAPEAKLGPAFEHAAAEALPTAPGLSAALLDSAVSAGVPARDVTARRALAAALAGQLDESLRLADDVIADESARDRTLAVQVAAAVLAQRGLPTRSAHLCRWSARYARWPGDAGFAALGLLSAGDLNAADAVLDGPENAGPPTSLAGAVTELAGGLRESITGSPTTALSTAVRAAGLAESAPPTVPVPETPAAVAAVIALHCGEFDAADSVLRRALTTGAGGPLHHRRHELLGAWLPLLRGDTVTAGRRLHDARGETGELPARDALLATALEAGIANRDNDTTALSTVRGRARDAAAQHPADLFSLLPLGEITVAMARFRDHDWLAPHLDRAWALLDQLGNPPLWSALLHWKCLHAAIIAERSDTAQRHADALTAVAAHNPMSSAMAGGARVWLRVLDGHVVPEEVERAAHGLHTAGLSWDAARIAGQAAIRTIDRQAMTGLLECARALQGKPSRPRRTAPSSRASSESGPTPEGGVLSDREKEVAELVLAGMTYKQVGKRLFISAKTVEHHIGRVRQRLGCSTRDDLFARLRSILEGRE